MKRSAPSVCRQKVFGEARGQKELSDCLSLLGAEGVPVTTQTTWGCQTKVCAARARFTNPLLSFLPCFLLLLMEPNQTKPRRRVSQGLLLVGMQGGERLSRAPTEADLTVTKTLLC